MGSRKRILSVRIQAIRLVVSFLLLTLSPSLFAESRELQTNIPWIMSLSASQTFGAKDESFYKNFIEKTDADVRRSYFDQWNYHEKQSQYEPLESRQNHLSMGSADVLSTSGSEGDKRNEFARFTFKLRMERVVRDFMTDENRPKAMQKSLSTFESVTNSNVSLLAKSSPRAQSLTFGYNIFTERFNVVYQWGFFSSTWYHDNFMTAATTGGCLGQNVSWGVETSSLIDEGRRISTIFNYRANSKSFETGLRREWNSQIQTQVIGSGVMVENAPPLNLNLQFWYSF